MPPDKLLQARVLLHEPAGRGYYHLVLKAPDAASSARPGQFVMLRISENRDPLLARPFGISSVIAKRSIELYYRVAGRGTSLLTAVEPGRTLSLLGPLGNGFPSPGKGVVPLLVAGGSGFPPLLFFSSSLRALTRVFIGARDRACLPPSVVIKKFKDSAEKVYIATENGSIGKRCLVTDMLDSHLASSKNSERIMMYACGPRPMLAAVARLAADRSVPCYVSLEERMACGLGACMGCSVGVAAGGYQRVCKDGPVFDSREIDWREQVVLAAPHRKR